MSPPRRLFVVSCLAMVLFGMVIAMLGALFGLPEMRARLGIDLAQQGQVFGVVFVGLLVATIAGGPWLDRFGSKPVVVGAVAAVTAGLALFALARGFAGAAGAALLLGLGGGLVNIGANGLVADLYPESRGRMLNLANAFFGVGALFVPLLVSVAFGALSVVGVLAVCTAVAAATLAIAVPLHFPHAAEKGSFSFRELLATARQPGVLLLAAVMFFQMGNEGTLSGWTSTYAGAMGWPARTATVILLGYWVMAIVGRSMSAAMQARVGNERLVLGAGTIAAVGCAVLLVGGRSLPVLTFGAWLTALALSPIVPTTLAIASDRYHRFGGTIFSLLFTVGSLGGMVFQAALGSISQSAGLRAGMLVPLVGTIAVVGCARFVLGDRSRTASRRVTSPPAPPRSDR